MAIKFGSQCQLVFPIDTPRNIIDQGLHLVYFPLVQLLNMEVPHARSVKAKVVENVAICFKKSLVIIRLELLVTLLANAQFYDFSCEKISQKIGLDVVLHHFNVLD